MDFSFNQKEDIKDALSRFARNVNSDVINNKIDPVIGREDEIRRIIEIICRKTKNNPILIGEPGVGKTAIVEGLAQRIVNHDVPELLRNKVIYELSLSSLIAGASYQGEFEKRLNAVIKEAQESNGNIILFIDEIHQLVGAGRNQGSMDAANILKPQMARGDIKLIGATTTSEYRQYIEKDGALERRMQKIYVNEPSVSEAITILRGLKERWELFHKVKIHDNAIVSAVKLSERYICDKYLPDKAIDLIDEAAAKIKTEMYSMPSELDKLNRVIIAKETEKMSLANDPEPISKNRYAEVEKELKSLKQKQTEWMESWQKQKASHDELINLKTDIEISKNKIEKLQIEGKYEQAAKLMYVEIPNMEKKVKKMEEASAKENKQTYFHDAVDVNEIGNVISRVTGIPLKKLLVEEKEKLINLEKEIQQKVKGQDKAVKIVADAILRSKAGVNDPNRPISSFLFLGPTGVGKTELAKALSICLFDTEKSLIRFDMSEYMEKHAVSKLLGAPPGYVGFDTQHGSLSVVRTKPYSVLLFDEIEKAHPEILDILLQILDDGILHDSKGNLINFKNTIIIMTSNIGGNDILEGKPTKALEELKKILRPEFINRIDEVINFNPIDEKIVISIVEKLMNDLEIRLKNEQILIQCNDKMLLAKIAKESYDPSYGARPIKRYIQSKIENFLAKNILEQSIMKNIQYYLFIDKNNNLAIKEVRSD